MSANTVYFVTGNVNKSAELFEILKEYPDVHIQFVEHDLDELQGNSTHVVFAKCKEALKLVNNKVIVEDTSLFFRALSSDEFSLPGPYIKDFYKALGNEGLYNLVKDKDTVAHALCMFAYYDGIRYNIFTGETYGKIVSPRAKMINKDFGWDPIFECTEGSDGQYGLTFAEMSDEKKNQISHRARGFRKLLDYIRGQQQLHQN
jgi:inosine triphosphate pyrophosphatase